MKTQITYAVNCGKSGKLVIILISVVATSPKRASNKLGYKLKYLKNAGYQVLSHEIQSISEV